MTHRERRIKQILGCDLETAEAIDATARPGTLRSRSAIWAAFDRYRQGRIDAGHDDPLWDLKISAGPAMVVVRAKGGGA